MMDSSSDDLTYLKQMPKEIKNIISSFYFKMVWQKKIGNLNAEISKKIKHKFSAGYHAFFMKSNKSKSVIVTYNESKFLSGGGKIYRGLRFERIRQSLKYMIQIIHFGEIPYQTKLLKFSKKFNYDENIRL